MKESLSSRTLSSLFLILIVNDFSGSSLKELGISFHSLAPIPEKAFFLYFKSWSFYVKFSEVEERVL